MIFILCKINVKKDMACACNSKRPVSIIRKTAKKNNPSSARKVVRRTASKRLIRRPFN